MLRTAIRRTRAFLRRTPARLVLVGVFVSLTLAIPAVAVSRFSSMYSDLGYAPRWHRPLPWPTSLVLAIPAVAWALSATLVAIGAFVAAYHYRNVVLSSNQHSILTVVTVLVGGGLLAFLVVALLCPLAG